MFTSFNLNSNHKINYLILILLTLLLIKQSLSISLDKTRSVYTIPYLKYYRHDLVQ